MYSTYCFLVNYPLPWQGIGFSCTSGENSSPRLVDLYVCLYFFISKVRILLIENGKSVPKNMGCIHGLQNYDWFYKIEWIFICWLYEGFYTKMRKKTTLYVGFSLSVSVSLGRACILFDHTPLCHLLPQVHAEPDCRHA